MHIMLEDVQSADLLLSWQNPQTTCSITSTTLTPSHLQDGSQAQGFENRFTVSGYSVKDGVSHG